MIRTVAYRLGAEELLELGNARNKSAGINRPYLARRKPMLANRRELGIDVINILATIAEYLRMGLSFALNTLGDIVDIPLNIL